MIHRLSILLLLLAASVHAASITVFTNNATLINDDIGRVVSNSGADAAFIREDGKAYDSIYFVTNSAVIRANMAPIVGDGFPRFFDWYGTNIWTMNCLGARTNVIVKQWGITGWPAPTITLLSNQTFGTNASVAADVVKTASGGLFAFWYDSPAVVTPTNASVWEVKYGVAYRNPTTGVWTNTYPISTFPHCSSAVGNTPTTGTHPVDGSVWMFSIGDSCGVINALKCWETNGTFAYSEKQAFISPVGSVDFRPDGEIPWLVSVPDATHNTLDLAYQLHKDRITWPSSKVSSYLGIAKIAADESITYLQLPYQTERTSPFGFTVDSGKYTFLFSWMTNGVPGTNAYITEYTTDWSPLTFVTGGIQFGEYGSGKTVSRLHYTTGNDPSMIATNRLLIPPYSLTPPSGLHVASSGLGINFNGSGQVDGVTLGGSSVITVGTGGFEIADYGASTNFTQVAGDMAAITGGASFTGSTNSVLITATVTTNASNIFVSGTLTNQVSTNRAIALRFRLPVDLESWTWHDDIGTTRSITNSITYQNVLATEAGSGLRSLYPLGTITEGGTNSLNIATPLSPSVFQIGYDNAGKGFFGTVFVALSTTATNNSGSASFAFTLYQTGPNGFRAAVNQYYSTYPTPFIRRQPFEAYYGYGFQDEEFNYSNHYITNAGSNYPIPNASDFGEGYDSIRSLHGTAYATTWQTNSVTRPIDAKFRAWLSVQPAGSLYPGSNAVLQLFLDSTFAIRYAASSYDPSVPAWFLEPLVNQDPDITSGLTAQVTLDVASYYGTYRLPWKPAIPSDFADGGFGSLNLDYDQSHVGVMDFPPTFGASTLAPSIVNGLWDFNQVYLHPRSASYAFTLIGNTGDADYLYSAPWLDVGMSEGARTLPEYRFYRTLSHHKIWRNWTTIGTSGTDVYTLPQFLSELQNCLALGIYPALGATVVGQMTETFRPYYRLYIPAIEEESRSGWEPVTYAVANNGALVERFGSYSATNLVLSVANTNAPSITATVTLDTSSLGVPVGITWAAQDLISLAYVAVTSGTLSVALTNGQTRAFSCLNTNDVWFRKVTIAQAYLDRLQRSFTNDLVAADNARISTLTASLAAVTSNSTLAAAAPTINAQITAVQSGIATPSQTDLSLLIARIRAALGFPTPPGPGNPSVVFNGRSKIRGHVQIR